MGVGLGLVGIRGNMLVSHSADYRFLINCNAPR